jgi:hypothetical protein
MGLCQILSLDTRECRTREDPWRMASLREILPRYYNCTYFWDEFTPVRVVLFRECKLARLDTYVTSSLVERLPVRLPFVC